MSYFHNPVRVCFGRGCLEKLPEVLGRRTCIVLTTPGMVRRGVVDRLKALCGDKILSVYAVQPNPTVASTTAAAEDLHGVAAQVILAAGGGSVLDTAKGVAAQRHPGSTVGWLAEHLREGRAVPSPFCPSPVIAVPTTAGTGSEVTMWATIWDERSGRKYSLSNPALYPEAAVVDPELTLTVPEETTVATALDALSHAMEAIWNRNANLVSDVLAAHAISVISSKLRQVLASPRDISVRERLHYASMVAGLAFSNTRTAIAHSISYPLTGQLGMPHGLACSFTLPEIMLFNGKQHKNRVELIQGALGCGSLEAGVAAMHELLAQVGMPNYVRRYFPTDAQVQAFVGDFIAPGRAENNIAPVTQGDAVEIFRRSAARMLGVSLRN